MPPLAEMQRQFAQALMTGKAPAALLAGCVPAAEALAIHRNTVLGALVNALRISHPTVDALVGPEFFDQTCHLFAQDNLPRTASLLAYGEGFAQFLAGFPPASALAYLPDVARLDRAVETALRAPLRTRYFALDAMVSIALPQSLAVLRLMHPADEIRAALDDDAAMGAIDMASAERFVLIWRKDFDAAVRRVDPAAGRFLISLLAGQGPEAAFAAATDGASETDVLRALQTDIFAASFCNVISAPEEFCHEPC